MSSYPLTRALAPARTGMEVPLAGQLRIIHQGRFVQDTQILKGEQTRLVLALQPLSPAASWRLLL